MPQRNPQARILIARRFPQAFSGKGQPKRPFKIGIADDIARVLPDMPPQLISDALRDYCGGPTYLRNVVAGATRIDLEGNEAGVVTESEARYAAMRLARLEARWLRNGVAQTGEKERRTA